MILNASRKEAKMKLLDHLAEYFPTGTTEGERHILKRAFVQLDEFSNLICPPPFSPRVLVGKKGSGKSAVIDFSMALFQRNGVPCLALKPLDIEFPQAESNQSVGAATRVALEVLTKSIAQALGNSASGLISESDSVLYSEAVAAGLKDRDTIAQLARLLPKLAKPMIKADLGDLLPEESVAKKNQLLRSIQNNLKKSGSVFYLFIDDTDQVAAPDQSGHLNRIWAFLLAARELCQKVEQLRCVISLREEVWRRISSDKASQRDQTDHFTPLAKQLNPSRDHIRQILEKRLELARIDAVADGHARSPNGDWPTFFDPKDPRIPTSDKRSSWPDLVVLRSRDRPRDAVQLINVLANSALQRNELKITDDLLQAEMVEFSRQRVELLSQESEQDLPELDSVIRSFAKLEFDHGSFKAKTETMREHLRRHALSSGVRLYGRSLRNNIDADVFELWRFLYMVGYLHARVSDTREKDGYRHLDPVKEPNFVSIPNWNQMQTVVWEISPVYRDFLITQQKNAAAQMGLPPPGRPFKGRR